MAELSQDIRKTATNSERLGRKNIDIATSWGGAVGNQARRLPRRGGQKKNAALKSRSDHAPHHGGGCRKILCPGSPALSQKSMAGPTPGGGKGKWAKKSTRSSTTIVEGVLSKKYRTRNEKALERKLAYALPGTGLVVLSCPGTSVGAVLQPL